MAAADTVKFGTGREKQEFMGYCFRKAMTATEMWIERLRDPSRPDFRRSGVSRYVAKVQRPGRADRAASLKDP